MSLVLFEFLVQIDFESSLHPSATAEAIIDWPLRHPLAVFQPSSEFIFTHRCCLHSIVFCINYNLPEKSYICNVFAESSYYGFAQNFNIFPQRPKNQEDGAQNFLKIGRFKAGFAAKIFY